MRITRVSPLVVPLIAIGMLIASAAQAATIGLSCTLGEQSRSGITVTYFAGDGFSCTSGPECAAYYQGMSGNLLVTGGSNGQQASQPYSGGGISFNPFFDYAPGTYTAANSCTHYYNSGASTISRSTSRSTTVTPTPTASPTGGGGGGGPTNNYVPTGYFDGGTCALGVSGWVFDSDHAGSLTVTIYADGAVIGTAVANQPSADVAAVFPGRNNVRYSFPIPPAFQNGAAHTYSVVSPNVDTAGNATGAPVTLAYSGYRPNTFSCGAASVAPIGFLEGITCATGAGGWVYDPEYAGATTVHLYEGATFLGATTTNQSRPDVNAYAVTVGQSPPDRTMSGWAWQIPAALRNGVSHSISAYAINVNAAGTPTGANPELIGSPKSITCVDQPTGTLDAVTCGGMGGNATGTATDPQGSPVQVTFFDGQAGAGGVQVGAGFASPNYSIAFPSFTNGLTHSVYAYAQGIPATDGWHQIGTKTVACAPSVTLSAAPASVTAGQKTTISWDVSNAISCTATPGGWFNAGSLANGRATSSGLSAALASTTTFSLTCLNAAGASTTGTVTVPVDSAPPVVTITDVQHADYCSTAPEALVNWQYFSAGGVGMKQWQIQIDDDAAFSAPIKYDTGLRVALNPDDANAVAITHQSLFRTMLASLMKHVLGLFSRIAFAADPTPVLGVPYTLTRITAGLGSLNYGQTYYIRARAVDTTDATSAWSATYPFTVANGPWPLVDFSFDPAKPPASESVQFTDATQYSPTSWLWTFGDGTSDTTQHPKHGFPAEGGYTIMLQATNAAGTCSKTHSINVNKPLPRIREVGPESNTTEQPRTTQTTPQDGGTTIQQPGTTTNPEF